MAHYSYVAFTKEGKKLKGSIEAASETEVKEKIRELSLLLAELKEQANQKGIKQFSNDSLIIFTTQLAQLVSAKIPLYESLLALEEQARREPHHAIISALAERIKSGSSFSRALQDFPQSFSGLYRALIAAGEAVGNIELALSRLSFLLSHQQKMKKLILSNLAYPIFLAVLMVLVVGVLFGFVIPSIEALFDGKQLPWFTTVVFGLSHLVRNWAFVIFPTLFAMVIFLFKYFKKPEVRKNMQRMALKTPFLKRFLIHSALGRFARTLATLLEGGLPLTNSLAFAKESLYNVRLEEIIGKSADKLIEGKTLSTELQRHKEIPALFLRMVKIGEESGKLPPMLHQVASIYDEETERLLMRIVTLTQPVMLLVMGTVIGVVILSILLPLSSFSLDTQM